MVLVAVWLLATHSGLVGDSARPQAFTRSASCRAACPTWSDTRLTFLKAESPSRERAAAGCADTEWASAGVGRAVAAVGTATTTPAQAAAATSAVVRLRVVGMRRMRILLWRSTGGTGRDDRQHV